MQTRAEKIEKAESTGIRVTAQIVREWWTCRFQEFESRNDDGIDGLIMIKKNGKITGELIHCQIKSGSGYKREYEHHIGITLGKKYVNDHKPRWDKIVEPVILIYVDEPADYKTMPKA